MANDTAVDQQQLQSTIDELYRKLTDALKAQLGTINVGENQALGLLSTADNLATAPVGDAATVRSNLNVPVYRSMTQGEDLNTITERGFYRDKNGTNLPADAAQYGQLIVAHGGADTIIQIYGEYNGTNLFWRGGNVVGNPTGKWNPWKRLITEEGANNFDIMPTVSGRQIVEGSNNSNGHYIIFSNGRVLVNIANVIVNKVPGDFGRATITFPITFQPYTIVATQKGHPAGSGTAFCASIEGRSTTSATLVVASSNGSVNVNIPFDVAIYGVLL